MTKSQCHCLDCQPRADRRDVSGYVMLLVLLLAIVVQSGGSWSWQ